MTDLAERSEDGLGRIGRLALRAVLVLILASPIVVGFLLAPKADDMPPPPELTAPASVTTLPEAVRRVLPTAVQDTTASRTMSGG
ncbi:MAG: hypothetical protein FJX54_08650 [Alphaproteobacteria bacterium]|nr:hypothetical protein [Alphaproteobacteria bacterium]